MEVIGPVYVNRMTGAVPSAGARGYSVAEKR